VVGSHIHAYENGLARAPWYKNNLLWMTSLFVVMSEQLTGFPPIVARIDSPWWFNALAICLYAISYTLSYRAGRKKLAKQKNSVTEVDVKSER
jgi:hypothetical protein